MPRNGRSFDCGQFILNAIINTAMNIGLYAIALSRAVDFFH
jgi:hypothetical protein